MFASKLRLVFTMLALSILPAGVGIGVAAAEGARVVVVAPPIFFPHADFNYDGGYFRTREGHYYHYDRDRDGWHYGRNHDEGVRYERGHGEKR